MSALSPNEIRIDVRDDASLMEELVYRLNFLQGVSWETDGDDVRVTWEEGDGTLGAKVREAVSSLGTCKPTARDVLFVSRVREALHRESALERLLADDELKAEGRGLMVLGNRVSRLMEYFDTKFLEFADSLGAERREYPALMAADILDKCGYFGSFPQYVGMVSHVIEDPHLYNEFGAAWNARAHGGFSQDKFMKAGECVLSPAVCYHCYNAMQGASVSAEQGRVVTARGKCFRYEAANMVGLERLWEFSMREVISIGTGAVVRKRRETGLKFVSELVNNLGLVGHIEVATDPFFVSDADAKRTFQAGFHLKYEMRLHLPAEGKTLAAASFNIHEDFFGRTFDITADESGPACTGCTAFGLERWAYAFLAQYGFDDAHWPAEVREFMVSGVHA